MTSTLKRIGRTVFGDRRGAIVFVAALSLYLSYWRVGILINDSYTVANTLVAVADGQLHVERVVYGPTLETPGMGARDGLAYGRNYGQVFLALPFLLTVETLAVVADLRVALAALWALLLLGLAVLVGRELGRPELAAYAGSSLALLAFGAVVWGAAPIEATQHALIALQLQTMVAAAFVGVVCYRLLARAYTARIGLAGGLGVVFATPIGFWAQFPKRHVLVTLCVVASMYLLYRSREGDAIDIRFRATAYIPVGIAAWVSAAEGLILLVALLAVDVLTGGRNLRSLATAGVTCVLACLPMFVTNYFVTGNPAEPPRVLTALGSGGLAEQGSRITGSDGSESGGSDGPGNGGSAGESTDPSGLRGDFLDTAVGAIDILIELYRAGINIVFDDFGQVYSTFVRGGYIETVATRDAGEAIRLSFLEAMPLAAGLVALPIIAARTDLSAWLRSTVVSRRLTALGTVDAFAVVYGVALTLVFLPRMPIHSSITTRFLLALFPIAIYGLARVPAVRRVVTDHAKTGSFAYLGGVLIGGQLLVVYLWVIDATRGEAVQAHAIVGLLTAGLLAGWVVADVAGYRSDRFGAAALGFAAASGTVFLALAALWHFSFVGPQALPLG